MSYRKVCFFPPVLNLISKYKLYLKQFENAVVISGKPQTGHGMHQFKISSKVQIRHVNVLGAFCQTNKNARTRWIIQILKLSVLALIFHYWPGPRVRHGKFWISIFRSCGMLVSFHDASSSSNKGVTATHSDFGLVVLSTVSRAPGEES